MIKWDDVSDAELQEELQRRAQHAEELKLAQRRAQEALWLTHIDALLALMPEHSRTSCSDDRPHNATSGEVRCSRCGLLYIKRYQEVPESWDIMLYLRTN